MGLTKSSSLQMKLKMAKLDYVCIILLKSSLYNEPKRTIIYKKIFKVVIGIKLIIIKSQILAIIF